MANIVSVVINRLARNVDKIYHYKASDELFAYIDIGSLVYVPFGIGDALVEAFVVGFPEQTEITELKEVTSIIEKESLFDRELLSVAEFMKNKYFATLISSLKAITPPGLGVHFNKSNEKTIKGAELNIEIDEAFLLLERMRAKAPMQTRVLELMIQNDFVSYNDIALITGCNYAVIKTLEKKGVLRQTEIEIYRNPIDYENIEKSLPLEPTEEQKYAIDKISACDFYKSFLLFGVTGSGKTEVFLQAIDNVIKNGKSAIVLVPEISLTPQTVKRFISRFGKRVAILHSKLSVGERCDEYKRIKRGEVDVAVGVRSAVFAPLSNLGIIIIDEEHENTYKSENIPSYDAREVAEYRAKYNNIPLVLSSATPDIRSFYHAKTNASELLTLTKRANTSKLPKTFIVDMRKELIEGNRSIFSSKLKEEIAKNIKNGEQTILFLNRRGFSTFVSCRNCGYVIKCNRCNISLTYHKHNDRLSCHYCGYTIKNIKTCPKCSSNYIKHFGSGTQKAEEEIHEFFPESSVLRMDVDTTSGKTSHSDILNKFKDEKTDILIGTQMIAKGLDFPNVTLVGVLAADQSLYTDDFKAGERTFDLITQVCGRAGRGKKSGRAIIQTYSPENDIIMLAAKQDYITFYENEIKLRRLLNYPPFCDIISLLFVSSAERSVEIYARKAKTYLEHAFRINNILDNIEILGPSRSNIERINDKYRWRILIKCVANDKIREIINNFIYVHHKKNENKWISLHVDYNPSNLI